MRRKKGVGAWELLPCLIVVVIGFFLGGVSAWAGDNDVILYEHGNYGGKQLKYTGDVQVPFLRMVQLVTSAGSSLNWNDQISSIQVGKNKKIVLYEHDDYGGASITLYGATICRNATGQYSSMPSGWNDRVSSFKIQPNDLPDNTTPYPDMVMLYEDINYCGAGFQFKCCNDWPTLGAMNDRFSSIKVGSNVILTVFEHINYGGASFTEVGPSNIPTLVPSGWNDRISSVKVRKRL